MCPLSLFAQPYCIGINNVWLKKPLSNEQHYLCLPRSQHSLIRLIKFDNKLEI